ncbi:hypothetical protein [Streptosporangium subroseum]|uniref:hypothetical protein n=1 Tax=Streptosporangium subroseum TaxID=106412 RepID=UPI003086ED4B|nr:hypothetical protein OHB15_13950 [Streptosporangium subroseum]
MLGIVAAVLGALIAGIFSLMPMTPDPSGAASHEPPVSGQGFFDEEIFLSRDRGPTGTTVKVSGEGFDPGASVKLYFHTTEIGRTKANGQGKFSNVAVEIPSGYAMVAPKQFFISGSSGASSADAPFMLTG